MLSVGRMEGASREQSLKRDEGERMTDETRLQKDDQVPGGGILCGKQDGHLFL